MQFMLRIVVQLKDERKRISVMPFQI